MPWQGQRAKVIEGDAYGDFLIARFAAMTNDPGMAAERYAEAIKTAPQNSGIAERAVFSSLLAGDYNKSVGLSETAAKLGSDATLVRLTLGVDAMRRGNEKKAAAYLDETEYGPFNRMVARGLSGWRIAEQDGTRAAEAYLTEVLTGDPRLDSATLYMLGLIQVSAKKDDEALKTFSALWADGARLAVGVEAYARLLAASGQRDEAINVLSAFRAEVGQNAALSHLRTQIEAGETVRPVRLTTRQGAALSVYVPAAALMAQTDDDLAGVYFVLALALDPELHVARSLWAQALDNAGRRDEAIAILKQVPEDSTYFATARGQMAWALRREDRNEAALDVAAEALKYAPDRDLKVQLSDLYRSLERHGEAEALLTEIIDEDAAQNQTDWRVLYARGTAREQLGKWPGAEADLKAALKQEPENASLLNYLGYSYVDRGKNLTEAFQLIQKAVALNPQSGFITDSLGWAHYKMGRYDMATRYLERAVALEPGDPVLNDHLGDAYWQVGRRTEARFQWTHALKMGPDESDVARIEGKLAGAPPLAGSEQAGYGGEAVTATVQRR